MASLTREKLDRLAMPNHGRVGLGCPKHPEAGTTAIYQDGDLRLLCRDCGFEAARVKVAFDRPPEEMAGLSAGEIVELLGAAQLATYSRREGPDTLLVSGTNKLGHRLNELDSEGDK